MINKLTKIIQEITKETFPSTISKQEVKVTNYSIQCACPFCGDSAEHERKKRGHLFTDSFRYYCFNCNISKDYIELLGDFDKVGLLDLEDLDSIDEISKKNVSKYNHIKDNITTDVFFDTTKIEKYSVTKKMIMIKFGLVEVQGTLAEKYLRGRLQLGFDKFLFSKASSQLFILNITRGGKVIGMQSRSLKKDNRNFQTYDLNKIREICGLPADDDSNGVSDVSLIFNIFLVDIYHEIKVLEGPLDAFLIRNAIALAGASKSLPFTFSNMVYIYDYDGKGIEKATEKINAGFSIFLWSKFMNDHPQLNIDRNGKVDINDVVLQAHNRGIPLKPLTHYYSIDKYDIIHL